MPLSFFTLIMDKIAANIQEDILYNMLFAKDIVSDDEETIGLNAKMDLLNKALEDKGLKIVKQR